MGAVGGGDNDKDNCELVLQQIYIRIIDNNRDMTNEKADEEILETSSL